MAMSSLAQKARRRSNMARMWNKSKVFVFLLIMALAGMVLVFPYFYMVSKSLMSSNEVIDPNVPILPAVPQFNNYLSIFTNENYLKALGNTCIIIGFNIIATLLSASLIAFSFAKLEWVGKRVMFILMMFTMMLPAVATQIPLYVMYARWHWIDTLLPLTIPNLFGGGAVYIFLLRQYMMGIPNNMIDAAMCFSMRFSYLMKIVFPRSPLNSSAPMSTAPFLTRELPRRSVSRACPASITPLSRQGDFTLIAYASGATFATSDGWREMSTPANTGF